MTKPEYIAAGSKAGKLKDEIFDAADLQPATQREVAATLDSARKP
ncbi:hypothetical protein [Occallatibacter riparius]|nr:hypothetical protein [Occallatibacter riparius]